MIDRWVFDVLVAGEMVGLILVTYTMFQIICSKPKPKWYLSKEKDGVWN